LLGLVEQVGRRLVAGHDAQGGFELADGLRKAAGLQVLLAFRQAIVEVGVAHSLRRLGVVRAVLERVLISLQRLGALLLLFQRGVVLLCVLIEAMWIVSWSLRQ